MEITGFVARMTQDEFNEYVHLDPELLAELGPRRTAGRMRWRKRRPVRMVPMRPIDPAGPWVDELDKQRDQYKQGEPHLWPPTPDLHPNGWVARGVLRRLWRPRG